MAEILHCPQCGAELPRDAPAGVCPKCVLALAAGSQPEGGEEAARTTGYKAGAKFVPPEPADLAKHFAQLEILELVGQGGMGVVYKARQRQLGRLVALKILPPEVAEDPAFAERFAREAQALAQLSHPHIVTVYDFGHSGVSGEPGASATGGPATGGLFYFLMEFVDGVNLRQLLRDKKLQPREALAIVPQICEALQFAHDEGIVHRDIKPENILIDKKGRVKIADFGLAKLLGRSAGGSPAGDFALTGSQQVMGTRHYMAPEQMERPLTVDHRADIFSLGVVFYEMLTGELPLGRFAPPSEKVQVDVRLDDVVLRTLEKEPERRYQHASDVKSDVEQISQSGPAAVIAASAEVLAPREDVAGRHHGSLGIASLWLSILGIVLPVCLAILAAIFIEDKDNKRAYATLLCGVLLVILEMVALGCGIAGRRTASGKTGLVISGILLLFFVYFLWERFRPDPGADPGPNLPGFEGLEKGEGGQRHQAAPAPAKGTNYVELATLDARPSAAPDGVPSPPPTHVAFSADGKTLIALVGSFVHTWELPDRKHLGRKPIGQFILGAKTGTLCPDGVTMTLVRPNGEVELWDIQKEQRLARLKPDSVAQAATNPRRALVAVAPGDQTVELWDMPLGKRRATRLAHQRISALAVDPWGDWVAGGCADGTVLLWGAYLDVQPIKLRTQQDFGPVCLAFGPLDTVAAGDRTGMVHLWDFSEAKSVGRLGPHPGLTSVAFPRTGKLVATGSTDGTVKLWAPADPKPTEK